MMPELRLNVAAILVNVNEPYTLATKKRLRLDYKQKSLKVGWFGKVSYSRMGRWLKILEMDGCEGCTTMWMHSMPVKSTVVKMVNFVMCFAIITQKRMGRNKTIANQQ